MPAEVVRDAIDHLINYDTGMPNADARVDLSKVLPGKFMDFHKACGEMTASAEKPLQVLFMPEVALGMMKRIAELANRKSVELSGILYGAELPKTNGNVEPLCVAYPVPAMKYAEASVATAQIDLRLARENAAVLGINTNMTDVFSVLAGNQSGQQLAEFHIHHAGLGAQFYGKPSGHPGGDWGDFYQIEKLLTTGSMKDRQTPYYWSVFTSLGGALEYTVTKSQNVGGRIVHEKIQIIEEH